MYKQILLRLIDETKCSRMDQVKFVEDTTFKKSEEVWSA